MSSAAERALQALDAGLQHSNEVAWGHTDRKPDRCARCQLHPPPDDGDLCTGCRAYVLGDTDRDPDRGPTPDEWAEFFDALADLQRALAEAFRPFTEAVARMAEVMNSLFPEPRQPELPRSLHTPPRAIDLPALPPAPDLPPLPELHRHHRGQR
jgi:hypothetical protein